MLQVGDMVLIRKGRNRFGWCREMDAYIGEIAHIVHIYSDDIRLDIDDGEWHWDERCLVVDAKKQAEVEARRAEAERKAKELREKIMNQRKEVQTVKTNREKQIVHLINRVKRSKFKATAVKVEMEGRIGRKGDYARNVVANDFLLEYLSQYGLARKKKRIDLFEHSEKWMPQHPLVFSKIYNDQETEWTFTIMLDKSENVLLLRNCIDAFNALREVNGKKSFNVDWAGMHTSFLQNVDGRYPSGDYDETGFSLFKQNATPLLPALFFVSANIKKGGKVVTRSAGCRKPNISEDKFNAIHYAGGALEFRVFDTCYRKREHILDNVAVMAKMVSNYWGVDRPTKIPHVGLRVFESTNRDICDWYVSRDQIRQLNLGLTKIKPSYLKVSDLKKARGFKKTLRTI